MKDQLVTDSKTCKGAAKKTKAPAAVNSPTPGQNSKKSLMALPNCCSCMTAISTDTKALQCELCESNAGPSWKCLSCLSLPSDVYDTQLTGCGTDLQWFCEACKTSMLATREGSSPANKLA